MFLREIKNIIHKQWLITTSFGYANFVYEIRMVFHEIFICSNMGKPFDTPLDMGLNRLTANGAKRFLFPVRPEFVLKITKILLQRNPMKILQSLALCTLTCFNTYTSQKAVINVPIADLLGQSITTMRPNESPHTAYHAIAFCGGQINSTYACPRLHQLLYNDIIDVIKTTDDEAQIRIAHAFYVAPSAFAKATADIGGQAGTILDIKK